MPKDSSNRGMLIALAYLWPLAVVPLLVEKHDREVRWHAWHGLVLMAAELVMFVAMWIVVALITLVAFRVGVVLSLGFLVAWSAILVLHMMAIVRGLNGKRLVVPGVSNLADRL